MTPVMNKNITSHLESTRAHERVMASYAFRGGGGSRVLEALWVHAAWVVRGLLQGSSKV